jgi:hypothetical protein
MKLLACSAFSLRAILSYFACIGYPAKAPDPARRDQVEHLQKRGQEKLVYCQQEGLVLEVERLKQLIHHCETELLEQSVPLRVNFHNVYIVCYLSHFIRCRKYNQT